MMFNMLFLVLCLPAVILGCAQIMAGIGMLRMEMRVWSQIVSWASFLPIHPAFPIAISISIWSLISINRRRAREAYHFKAKTGSLPVNEQQRLHKK